MGRGPVVNGNYERVFSRAAFFIVARAEKGALSFRKSILQHRLRSGMVSQSPASSAVRFLPTVVGVGVSPAISATISMRSVLFFSTPSQPSVCLTALMFCLTNSRHLFFSIPASTCSLSTNRGATFSTAKRSHNLDGFAELLETNALVPVR